MSADIQTDEISMREWFTPQEVLAVLSTSVPSSEAGLRQYILKHKLRDDEKLARRRSTERGGWEYHINAWPCHVQLRLVAKETVDADELFEKSARSSSPIWHRYEQLTDKQREKCADKLKAIEAVHLLWRNGVNKQAAVQMVGLKQGFSVSSFWTWERLTHGFERKDWLAALAPNHSGRSKTAPCHPDAWAFFKADALRLEKPNFAMIYRDMKMVAEHNGWSPIPSCKTLERRFKKEIPYAARVLARDGVQALKASYPHQTRDRSYMHAMYAANSDGHKFDFFVQPPNGEKPTRIIMLAIQDLYSGMILAHRIGWSEHKHLVRLAIGDMLKEHGIPEKMFLDNGKAFASKDITGGAKSRHRFKIKEEEPDGLLTLMGVETIFVTPYHGQAKPIERAFRDMCSDIAKHPKFAGAYTGNTIDNKPANYGSRAVPLELAKEVIASEIERHNQRVGRRMRQCKGRSFYQTFQDSLASMALPPARPAPSQERLWLLSADHVKVKARGEIHIMGNRYWSLPLQEHIKQSVTVRFDPDDLTLPLHVYDLKGSFICEASYMETVRFEDQEAWRANDKKQKEYKKATKRVLELENTMSLDEVANLQWAATPKPQPKSSEPQKVHRLATGTSDNSSNWTDREDDAFGRAVAKLAEQNGELLQIKKRARNNPRPKITQRKDR